MSNVILRAPTPEEVAQAKLPARYEAAKTAIAECDRLDELKDLADKHAALASYARMANDDTMRVLAVRIQARALQRAGKLLEQIQPARGANQNIRDGAVPKVTRESAADAAGLSERQRKTALRVANVPEQEFDAAVDSVTPPTITELAMRGTVSRPQVPDPVVIVDPAEVDDTQSALRAFAEFCNTHEAVGIARSIAASDATVLRGYVDTVDAWLDRFVTNLQQ